MCVVCVFRMVKTQINLVAVSLCLSIAHSVEVLSMVERSGREVAIERLLRNMEEVWLSKQFHFKPHTRFVLQVSRRLCKLDAHMSKQSCFMYMYMYM